jgi:hypothetical protein
MNAMELAGVAFVIGGLVLLSVWVGYRIARLSAGLPAPPLFPSLEIKAAASKESGGNYLDEAIFGKEGNQPTADR